MTLLRTYIVLAVLRGVATVMAVLLAVTCVIEFVGQLNDVGTGDYGLQTALIYVGLRVPGRIFTMLPIGALIGALLSLGNLAVHRELVVMRASGVSSLQLLSAVGLGGLVLAVLMVLLGESVAPSLGAAIRTDSIGASASARTTISARLPSPSSATPSASKSCARSVCVPVSTVTSTAAGSSTS